MKLSKFTISLTLAFSFLHVSASQAQTIIEDSFTMEAGYADMVFYSLESGVVAQSPLSDWHIAVDVRPMGSSARINCCTGMKLYPYGTLDNWLNIYFENWAVPTPLRNDQSDWANGAFNQEGDGLFDLGWGVYYVITHEVQSDKMYLIELPDGTWKQFALLSLVDGTYDLQIANIDGTEETAAAISKSDFEGKLFAYLNLESGSVLDLEPNTPWDFQFLSYTEDIGGGTYYSVVGALAHPDVTVQQSDNLDDPYTDGDFNVDEFSLATNEVGYDWKSYVPGSGYALESNRCYFVAAQNGVVWRMVMTGFDGASTGNITLGKTEATTSSVERIVTNVASQMFPNPAASGETVMFDAPQTFANALFRVHSVTGSLVNSFAPAQFPYVMSTHGLAPGCYVIEAINGNGERTQSRFMIR